MALGPNGVFLAVFLGFVLVMIAIGVWAARRSRTGEDFLLAGRGLGRVLLVGTTLATLVGTGSSLGAVGYGYENGWAGALYGMGGAAGVFALLWLFSDVRRYRFMTFPEEMSFYYGAHRPLKHVVSVALLLAEIGWLGAHVQGGALYLSHLADIDTATAKIVVAVAFGLYTVIGGYLAVVVTDVVQGTILFVGFTVLAVLALVKVGGFGELSASLSDAQTSFLGIGGIGWIPAVSLAVNIAVGVLATPSYRQRIYSAASVSTVRVSFALVGILFAVFAIMPAIAGMAARVLNPDMSNADLAFPFLATGILPVWIGAFLLVAGLSTTMSSGDSDAVTGVTILLRDVVQLITGRLPRRESMVRHSRIAIAALLAVALVFALLSDGLIEYITLMISTLLSGLFVAAVLGKCWSRATWQGGIASIITGSAAALVVNYTPPWLEYWGNPILPSLAAALAAGVLVSLVTPRTRVSREEALARLAAERASIDPEGRADEAG